MDDALATVDLDDADVFEEFHRRGWSDGLPVVPPTPERVGALLGHAGLAADDVLGSIEARARSLTAQQAAANAVMAGCAPEHFPLVTAALCAMLDPAFNAHTVMTSTGGAAFCLLVSGPVTRQLDMATRHNALGPGNRANASVGRALRLVARNVFGARTGEMDASSIGHPGKFTLCLAEDEPPSPWAPLRVELGYGVEDSTVTILATEGPRQVANHLNPSPEGILATMAAAMRCPATYPVGKGAQAVVVLGPEHAAALIAAGWTRARVREFLTGASRVTPAEIEAAGVFLEVGTQHDMTPGPDGRLPTVRSAEDIFLVTAGGHGAGWSAYLPVWAPTLHSIAVTRRVPAPGAGLPQN
ncbi:MAG: hypothetical protein OXG52_09490 [bacterium]|nr:hypothetical protein [bacterium]